jgi:hypothetical protein
MVVTSELKFRNRSQQIRDSLEDHEQMSASFGPSVEKNPSPSDPIINADLFESVVKTIGLISISAGVKFMHLGKLFLAALCIKQAKGEIGCNARCDYRTHGNKVFGRLLSHIQDCFFFLFITETKDQKMGYNLSLKFFDSKKQFDENDGLGGETLISVNFRSRRTLLKFVGYIYAKLGVSVGLEKVLPIRGNTNLIKQLDDFELSIEIEKRELEEAQKESAKQAKQATANTLDAVTA